MPSSIAHAAMAIFLRPTLPPRERNAATVGFAAVAAIALDIDAIGRPFGGGDVAFMGGHRAITHSVAAAVSIAVTGAVVLVGRQRASSIKAVFPYLAFVIMTAGVAETPSSRLRTLTRPAALAFTSIAVGIAIGLLELSSPRQVSAYLSILGERTSSAGRLGADSTRRLIAAAEAAATSPHDALGDRAPRTLAGARRCVAVQDSDAMAVSGDVTAGGWSRYRRAWMLGGGDLWWRTSRPSVGPSDTLSVRAIRLERALPPGAERNSSTHLRRVSRSGDTCCRVATCAVAVMGDRMV